MKHRVNRMIVMLMAVALALPAMAQWSSVQLTEVVTPSARFQSTSTMQTSGSRYSSTPTLSSDGYALYGDGSGAQAQSQGMPRRIAPPVIEGDPTPIGDAAIPLLLMALLYVVSLVSTKNLKEKYTTDALT